LGVEWDIGVRWDKGVEGALGSRMVVLIG
jgi:hypothetical protein